MRNISSLLRQPILHFVVLGFLLYLASGFDDKTATETGATIRPQLEVASSRFSEAEIKFRQKHRRRPNEAESAELMSQLIDEEVLFRHAVELGLHRAPVPQRRLAQIAAFVGQADSCVPQAAGSLDTCAPIDNPEETAELALRAVELGLHEGDYVTRRILVDAAHRLIRSAARLIEPGEEAMASFLEAHAEDFRGEARFRVSHVLLREMSGNDKARAIAHLERTRPQDEDWEETVAAMAAPGLVAPHLPLLEKRALERRFGAVFAGQIADLPTGEWSGPVRSRYGQHFVFVHERQAGRLPTVAEVAPAIRAKLREEAADRWLAERLRLLRERYDIIVPNASVVATTRFESTDSSQGKVPS